MDLLGAISVPAWITSTRSYRLWLFLKSVLRWHKWESCTKQYWSWSMMFDLFRATLYRVCCSGWGSWSQHSPGCLIRCIYFSCGREGARRVVSEIVYSALILQTNSHSIRAPLIPALIPWVLFHNSHDETAPDAAALVSAAAGWFFFIHVIPNRNDGLKRFQ